MQLPVKLIAIPFTLDSQMQWVCIGVCIAYNGREIMAQCLPVGEGLPTPALLPLQLVLERIQTEQKTA